MKEYLDRYMLRDLTQTATFTRVQDMTPEEKAQFEEERKQAEKRRNPYGLKFGQVSEEEIIKRCNRKWCSSILAWTFIRR